MKKPFPAIWVRFTPYLVAWAEKTYGTGVEISGRQVVELRRLHGVVNALRKPVDEDLLMTMDCDESLSQMRYDIAKSVENMNILDMGLYVNPQVLQTFLPVHVPEYLLTADGVIRAFSRVMQLQRGAATFIAKQVYRAFWKSVQDYSAESDCDIDRDMIEEFCEKYGVPSVHVDDLRNQFQRMKRNDYFIKER